MTSRRVRARTNVAVRVSVCRADVDVEAFTVALRGLLARKLYSETSYSDVCMSKQSKPLAYSQISTEEQKTNLLKPRLARTRRPL